MVASGDGLPKRGEHLRMRDDVGVGERPHTPDIHRDNAATRHRVKVTDSGDTFRDGGAELLEKGAPQPAQPFQSTKMMGGCEGPILFGWRGGSHVT